MNMPDLVTKNYGPPIVERRHGKSLICELNPQYFPALYAHENRIIYEPASKRFFRYSEQTGLWEEQSDAKLRNDLSRILQDIVVSRGLSYLLARRSYSLLQGMVESLRGMTETVGAFERKKDFIHVANGVLNIKDDGNCELMPFDPDYRSRSRSEIAWDPRAECPTFIEGFLKKALSDADILLIRKYFGQCLLGRNMSHTILLLCGVAGAGKSTIVDIVERVINPYNVRELRVKHLTGRFEIAHLNAATTLTGKDLSGGTLTETGAYALKKIVGGDLLSGEKKGVNGTFPIRGIFNVIMVSNPRLRIKLDADEDAWRRRLLIVIYAREKPDKPIPDLAKKRVRALFRAKKSK